MVTSKDIEAARREYVIAMGTENERHWRRVLEALVEQAKREHQRQR